MTRQLIPAQEHLPDHALAESPFQRLTPLSRPELLATRAIPAAERRLLPDFVDLFQWSAIRPRRLSWGGHGPATVTA
jgi:hypothetical protein